MADEIKPNSEVVLDDHELDAVTGGFMQLPLAAAKVVAKTNEGSGGGQNDPAQMFQQILQQLTHG